MLQSKKFLPLRNNVTVIKNRLISKNLLEYGFKKAQELSFKTILVEGNPQNYNPRGFQASYRFGIEAGSGQI